ncbi:secreted RxLR effector protein 161-like [Arachis stenosperma]|uniref:secreted RxLR effector protein 161-like n=1 Tax=Arachis stenosperma TaxID=217475 RepID=UPI0025AD5AF1|nr:secreted RxLR effector protein 161-like [Arachis stenosperma]
MKDDKFCLDQCPKNELEKEQMQNIPYASVVRSLMYAQVCTRPDIGFAVSMLGRYQNSDLAKCIDSRKSTSGYIFMLANGAVSWKSAK